VKIQVESERIVKAVRKLYDIQIVLENEEDARGALDLILKKQEELGDDISFLRNFAVKALRHYETSAVDYKTLFLLEFQFDEKIDLDTRVKAVQTLQHFFDKI